LLFKICDFDLKGITTIQITIHVYIIKMGRWVIYCNIHSKVKNPLLDSRFTAKSLKCIKNDTPENTIVFEKWDDVLSLLEIFNIILPYNLTENDAMKIHNRMLHYECNNHHILWHKDCVEYDRNNPMNWSFHITKEGELAQKWTKNRKIKTTNNEGICTTYYLDMRKFFSDWDCGYKDILNSNNIPFHKYELELDIRYNDNKYWDVSYPLC